MKHKIASIAFTIWRFIQKIDVRKTEPQREPSEVGLRPTYVVDTR